MAIESRVGVSWIYSVLVQEKNYLLGTNCVGPEKIKILYTALMFSIKAIIVQ